MVASAVLATLLSDAIVANQHVTLAVGGPLGSVSARLSEVREGERIVVTVPHRAVRQGLAVGSDVVARLGAQDDASYVFTATVVDVTTAFPPAVVLAWPEDARREQYRHHVRLAFMAKLSYAEVVSSVFDRQWCDGVGLDLSGSGLRMLADQLFVVGADLWVRSEIEGRTGALPIEQRATVVRVDTGDWRAKERHYDYRYGLRFADLAPRTEDAIVAAINWQLTRSDD